MKFSQEVTAGRLYRKSIRELFNNAKDKLEFWYPECSILVTETKTFWESSFCIQGKNLPDEAAGDIKDWMNRLKQLED